MNSPVGVLLSAFLFGMLRSASISMSLTSQVTTEMISVLQGFIVMLVASPDVWNVLGHLWQRLKSCVGGAGNRKELLNNGFLDLICQLFCLCHPADRTHCTGHSGLHHQRAGGRHQHRH